MARGLGLFGTWRWWRWRRRRCLRRRLRLRGARHEDDRPSELTTRWNLFAALERTVAFLREAHAMAPHVDPERLRLWGRRDLHVVDEDLHAIGWVRLHCRGGNERPDRGGGAARLASIFVREPAFALAEIGIEETKHIRVVLHLPLARGEVPVEARIVRELERALELRIGRWVVACLEEIARRVVEDASVTFQCLGERRMFGRCSERRRLEEREQAKKKERSSESAESSPSHGLHSTGAPSRRSKTLPNRAGGRDLAPYFRSSSEGSFDQE